jgi:hypothetical protein
VCPVSSPSDIQTRRGNGQQLLLVISHSSCYRNTSSFGSSQLQPPPRSSLPCTLDGRTGRDDNGGHGLGRCTYAHIHQKRKKSIDLISWHQPTTASGVGELARLTIVRLESISPAAPLPVGIRSSSSHPPLPGSHFPLPPSPTNIVGDNPCSRSPVPPSAGHSHTSPPTLSPAMQPPLEVGRPHTCTVEVERLLSPARRTDGGAHRRAGKET